uniref:Uncharacterized protein n=1 Tax=Romanomermis culicivorax TaxID=13658 RepID=A0A915KTL3_ROMCU
MRFCCLDGHFFEISFHLATLICRLRAHLNAFGPQSSFAGPFFNQGALLIFAHKVDQPNGILRQSRVFTFYGPKNHASQSRIADQQKNGQKLAKLFPRQTHDCSKIRRFTTKIGRSSLRLFLHQVLDRVKPHRAKSESEKAKPHSEVLSY